MKKVLLIAVFWVINLVSYAQTNIYHPFPSQNAFWGGYSYYFQTLSNNQSCQYFQNFTVGDTMVGNFLYHKLRESGLYYPLGYCNSPLYTPIQFDNYVGAFREDTLNKKVYYLPSGNSTDTLLYDFNLQLGDTLPETYCNQGYPGNWVSKIDSVLVGNKFHKRYGIKGPGFGLFDSIAYLIEGVGCVSGGILGKIHGQFMTPSGAYLWCFMVNGIKLYPDIGSPCTYYFIDNYLIPVKEITIAPSPFSQSTQITLNQSYQNVALAVYDIQGKQVAQQQYKDCDKIQFSRNQLSNGLYFLKLTLDDKEVETGKIVISE
jgi:hypothetical protein